VFGQKSNIMLLSLEDVSVRFPLNLHTLIKGKDRVVPLPKDYIIKAYRGVKLDFQTFLIITALPHWKELPVSIG
jgi:hypothetical protein